MQELVLKGESFDQGVTIGQSFRSHIGALIERHERPTPSSNYLSPAERDSECPTSDDADHYLAQCAELLFYLQEHVPDIAALMRGVARGAGCSFESIFRLNCCRAIAATRPRVDLLEGCSAVIAPTDDAGLVMSRSGDGMCQPGQPKPRLPRRWLNDLAVFKVLPARGLKHILVGSVATLVTGDGMNEAGVSFGCLNLPYGPPRMGGGIPYNLVGRALAPRAESVETAQEILTGWRQTSRAKSWPLVDGNGHSLAVEKCFDRTGVVKPDEEGVMALANDYLSPQLEDLADRDPSSAERAKTLREFVATQRLGGALTVETMMDALRIHATVGSICRHGGFEPSDRGGFTGSAVVYLPEKREMHVMCGDHPCRAAFHALTFDF